MSAELDSITPKYQSLYTHLVSLHENGQSAWQTTFSEIEDIIGDSLPPSARDPSSLFWNNLRQPRRASTAWFHAGWKTSDVDAASGTLSFRLRT